MASKRRKIPRTVRLAVYERDGWACRYCSQVFTPGSEGERSGQKAPWIIATEGVIWLELDHVTPHSAGGADTVENFKAACTPCNRLKYDSTINADWPARIAKAQAVLDSSPAGRAAAQSAARALLGIAVRIDEHGRVFLPDQDGKGVL